MFIIYNCRKIKLRTAKTSAKQNENNIPRNIPRWYIDQHNVFYSKIYQNIRLCMYAVKLLFVNEPYSAVSIINTECSPSIMVLTRSGVTFPEWRTQLEICSKTFPVFPKRVFYNSGCVVQNNYFYTLCKYTEPIKLIVCIRCSKTIWTHLYAKF